ncbi:MAG: tetratricopeptide repeat protein [Planctomycetota bacterium]
MRMVGVMVLAAVLTSSVRADDQVEYLDDAGKRVTARGNIREETPRELAIQTNTDRVAIPIYRIQSVKYDGQPPELITVRAKERQGRFDEAMAEYTQIGTDLGKEDADKARFLLADIAFGVFRCLAESAILDPAKADQALAWHAKHGSKFTDSRQYFEMRELLGRVHLTKKDYEAAAKEFAALKEVDWPGYQEKATKYAGIAALRQGNLVDAAANFDKVIEGTAKDPVATEQRHEAKVYKGEVLVAEGKGADAEVMLREALKEIPEESVSIRAQAHNALGDAIRQAKNNDKLAMLDGYMWVNVLYDRDPEQLARALYNLSGIFRAIGQGERAEQMASRLKNDFPNSDWTKKLEAPMQ